MNIMKMLIGGLMTAALFAGATAHAQIASDNASNYAGGWTNESNGGTGFGSWVFNINSSTGFAGGFIGNPADAGVTTNSNFGNPSFGLYANPPNSGASASFDRNLSARLNPGDTFSFQWGVNWDSGAGNKGFNLYAGGAGSNEIVNVNMGNFPGNITFNGQLAIDGNAGFGTHPMTWSFKMLSATKMRVSATGRTGTTNEVYSTNITVSAAPNGFRWYTSAMEAGDQRQAYFNNLLVVTGAPASLAFASGVSTPTNLGPIEFTLERDSANVAESIDIILTSDNTSAVTVPGTVAFAAGSNQVVFAGEVVSLTAGPATITAEDPFFVTDTFTVNIPLPGLSISGPGGVLIGSTNTYSVTRTGFVGSNVTISSSNAGILNPTTTNLVFEGGSNSVSFTAVAITNGLAALQAFGDVVTSAVYGVTVVSLPPTPTNIYDDATFYPLGWPNNGNGGNGFAQWSIVANGGGTFIGDASIQGSNNAAINTDGNSFGMWVSGLGNSVNASRSFSNALVVGDSFGFSMAYKWDNGTRGFTLNDNASEVFFFTINPAGFSWSGGGTTNPIPWQNELSNSVREAGAVLDVSIKRSPTGVDVSITSVQAPSLNISGSYNSGDLTSYKLFLADAGGDPDGNFYANKFSVSNATNGFLSLSGPANVLDVATPIYTLTRNSTSLVADVVQLASSSTNAAEVPASVTFGAGQLTTTFRLDTKAAGVTTLTATNSSASAAPLAVTVTAGPTNIHDLASYYFGDWRDGDNNGRGFAPWVFSHNLGSNGFAGVFVGDPAVAGISGMDAASFGFYANPVGSGANAEVSRAMPALALGDRLSFQWGINWPTDDNLSNRGFELRVGGTPVVSINAGNSDTITINGTNMLTVYGTNAIALTFTHETLGNLRVTATGRDGIESFTSELIPVPGVPDNFKFYFNANNGDANRQMYVNNFAITNVGTGGPVVLPPGTENTTASAITMISGRPNVSVLSTSNLFYYLVSPTGVLSQVTASPVNLSQWTVITNAVGTGGPITLIDSGSTTNVRYYGILIRSEALAP